MTNDGRISLSGVMVYPFASFDELLALALRRKGILVAINAEKILHATPQLRDIINRNIGYADGAGCVLGLHHKGKTDAVKLPGCELWLKIVAALAPQGKTFYLVGGRQEVIEETVAKLRTEFPAIRLAGYRNGFVRTPQEREALLADIERVRPDVVFVAQGSPRQELLMEEMQARHAAIYQGLGGSFDVYTGHVHRAPRWWVRHNLEFLYRLLREPKRLRRQIHLVRFLWLLTRDKI